MPRACGARFRVENPDWTTVCSGLDVLTFRIGRFYNPDWTTPDTDFARMEFATMTDAPTLFQRLSADCVEIALRDTPVVLVTGPRQCGKTTLVRELIGDERTYVTLDDDTALEAAANDPAGFVRGFDRVVIDEVHRVPALLRAIKQSVDGDRRPGRFLLTGSANVLTLPRISESLAGRMELVTLLPLSRAEVLGKKPMFLEQALAGRIVKPTAVMVADELVRIALIGGYPEMLKRSDPRRRQAWARDYVDAIVRKDVRDIVELEKLDRMPRLLQALAHHSGQLVNFMQLGAALELDGKTISKYVTVLEQLYLVRRLAPWFRNRLKRLVKTPKLHFLDSGLLSLMLGATLESVANNRMMLGPLLETFVFSEILKQTTWLDEPCTLYHYRDKDKDEVDIVIEGSSGATVGIEIKATATVGIGDFKGLRKLAGACGRDFRMGAVLYDGERTVPFGDRFYAAPISCLWV